MSAKDLLLSAIVQKNVTPVPIPEIPELDGKIFVRVLSAAERHLYISVQMDAKEDGQRMADYEIVAICACEEDGTPIFHTRDDQGRITLSNEDVKRLRDVDGRAVVAIANKALEVSGLFSPEEFEKLKKSLQETQKDDSSSA